MARAVSPVPSQDTSDNEQPKKKTSPSKSKKNEEVVETESEPADEEAGEGGDEEEQEEGVYEIEEILDARKGIFEKGKLGYFVKWLGYEEDQNSWVTEEDAEGAGELINLYWDKVNAKKAASKRGRKSAGVEETASEAGESVSAPPAAKKRGRKSAAAKEEEERPVKKARKSAAADNKKGRSRARVQEEEGSEESIGNMSAHMDDPDWSHLIQIIDTVERVDDKLFVYFTLNTGERIREDSELCGDKFPKMLLRFYESNLRWKEAEQ
ncbi:hypothetical protein FB45DRAFT_926625 [Roridomyces roridus]|uniref:Chromo domain-containing protein n=1 Tax=Roridomyces roridus TaxID=1738132 RepID=A0AAD7BKL9_9AGAR|nr:hypothetical protein FB45DRAFT_926625 [Roridomyces roridus]